MTYPVKILEACLPNDQLEMVRAEIEQDIMTLIPQCPGQSQETPATSCLEISRCNPQLPSHYYWITSPNGTAIRIYCDMTRVCSCDNATVGGWSRVAYLNMTDPIHQCPPQWKIITEPVRTCGRTNETLVHPFYGPSSGGGCSSVSFSTYNISYSLICGKVIGHQFGSPGAFTAYTRSWYTRIEDPYVDGVVITRGTEKQHIWTFAGELSEMHSTSLVCFCTNPPNTSPIPLFVGDNYFCETGANRYNGFIFYPNDPLWDGENCGLRSVCCEFNNPPYFCQSLPETTSDDIEVRICADENLENEDTPIELIEIFVR